MRYIIEIVIVLMIIVAGIIIHHLVKKKLNEIDGFCGIIKAEEGVVIKVADESSKKAGKESVRLK